MRATPTRARVTDKNDQDDCNSEDDFECRSEDWEGLGTRNGLGIEELIDEDFERMVADFRESQVLCLNFRL